MLTVELIEKEIKKHEPSAKEITYTTIPNKNWGSEFVIRYKTWRKINQIKVDNTLYQLAVAEPSKKLDSLLSKYMIMREEFDKEVKKVTVDIQAKYKPKFKKFDEQSEAAKKEKDELTNEFLIKRIDYHFNK